jgi:UDP-2,3-diacylglucosamine hydrolase
MNKLGILAGGGELPRLLIHSCREQHRPFHVIAFEGHADPVLVDEAPHDWVRLGAVAETVRHLKRAEVGDVVFAGKVARPTLRELMPDWRAALFLARIGGRLLSDNRLLAAIVQEFEAEGFTVVGPADVAAALLARPGPYGSMMPTEAEARAIMAGFVAARENGRRDMGQAAVVQDDRVIDVEGPDGTDALIDRCAVSQKGGHGAILVKARKPQQEMRADPPVVGPATVRRAAAAHFRGIAVEVGGVLVLEAAVLGQAADAAGLFLVGVEVPP